MSRTFIYARVSTVDQNTDNQIHEIESAGFAVDKRRIVRESISGSVGAAKRPQFARLLDRLEPSDVLIVTKLDRLGRNAMDVRGTVEQLAGDCVRVHCLALGGVDLTSPAGKMTMSVLSAVAEFERDLLIERTQAGLARARAEGKTLGRRPALTTAQQADAMVRLVAGESVAKVARDYGTTRQSIMRVRARHTLIDAADS
ncbi:recombinase family protein [Massilia sp. CCM 8734]|uniref:recombinase family protein n=1 Tax=Massilia sp. CCM 8734 TaxID=2609283 RepID=UPI001422C431|nr:recombinase family protein [Massilia sp. CCM 8734]NHZ99084.1 recombinase family protein [Massilia sp. CCM 8734]